MINSGMPSTERNSNQEEDEGFKRIKSMPTKLLAHKVINSLNANQL